VNLVLLENPIRRSGRYVDQFGNPVRVASKPRRRNPKMARMFGLQRYMAGVRGNDIVAGGVGLAAATMLPNVFLKTEPVTNMDKAIKVGVSALSAMAAGYFMGAVAGKAMAKPAVIGGLAGTAVNTVNMIRPGTIGASRRISAARALPVGRVSDARTVSPAMSREGEDVVLIRP
jgi:hypothetical protein